jgi:hypothetical protein
MRFTNDPVKAAQNGADEVANNYEDIARLRRSLGNCGEVPRGKQESQMEWIRLAYEGLFTEDVKQEKAA